MQIAESNSQIQSVQKRNSGNGRIGWFEVRQ